MKRSATSDTTTTEYVETMMRSSLGDLGLNAEAYFVPCLIGAAIAVRAALDGVRINVGDDGAITHVDSWFMTIDDCRLVDGWWCATNPALDGRPLKCA